MNLKRIMSILTLSFSVLFVFNKHNKFCSKNKHTQIYTYTDTHMHALDGLSLLWKLTKHYYMNKSLGMFTLEYATKSCSYYKQSSWKSASEILKIWLCDFDFVGSDLNPLFLFSVHDFFFS